MITENKFKAFNNKSAVQSLWPYFCFLCFLFVDVVAVRMLGYIYIFYFFFLYYFLFLILEGVFNLFNFVSYLVFAISLFLLQRGYFHCCCLSLIFHMLINSSPHTYYPADRLIYQIKINSDLLFLPGSTNIEDVNTLITVYQKFLLKVDRINVSLAQAAINKNPPKIPWLLKTITVVVHCLLRSRVQRSPQFFRTKF